MKFGLAENTIQKINDIFSRYEDIDQVILYGSRAKGDFNAGSDIDLTVRASKMNITELMRIENQIDDLLLPYKIDLSLFHQISDPDLIEHINRVGKVFFENEHKN